MKQNRIIPKQSRTTSLLIAGPSLIALACHAYLGTFSRWIADDYCSGAEAAHFGVLRAAWFWLRTWNGRYAADLLDAFFGILGPGITPVVTSIVLIVWLAVLSSAVHVLLQGAAVKNRGWTVPLASAAVILSATLALAPTVAQSLYWGQGMRSVVPPLVTISLYVTLFAWSGNRTWRGPGLGLLILASFALVFGAGGFSETFTALQVGAFSLAMFVWLARGRRVVTGPQSIVLCAGMLASILAFVCMVASPGNAGRLALSPPPPGLLQLIQISMDGFVMFLGDLLHSPLDWISLAAAFALGLWLGAIAGVQVRGWRIPLGIASVGTILVLSAFPPAAYGTSGPPFDRTLIIPVYIIVVMLVALGVSLSHALATRPNSATVSHVALIILMTLGAILTIAQTAKVKQQYAAYAEAWSHFHAQMTSYERSGIASADVETVELKKYNWTDLDTIGDNPKFWLNKCVSAYYHVNVISTIP